MTINPIIPIPAMIIICIILLLMKRKGVLPYIVQVLIVILLFVVNLRIMIHSYDVQMKEYPLDILFVIDDTISMQAEDYNGENPRMSGVKEDCKHIMDTFPGARYSVITFANEARQMIPYTSDVSMVYQMIGSLHGQSKYYAKGTSFSDVISAMKRTLDKGEDKKTVVFFISDGEVTNRGRLESFAELSEYIGGGAVLGYGTEEGGYMKAPAYSGEDVEYIEIQDYDYNYVKAVSCIDESNLNEIAEDLDLKYIHMTKTEKIDSTLDGLKNFSDGVSQLQKTEGFTDIYYWFLIPLVALLVFDLIYCKRKLDF